MQAKKMKSGLLVAIIVTTLLIAVGWQAIPSQQESFEKKWDDNAKRNGIIYIQEDFNELNSILGHVRVEYKFNEGSEPPETSADYWNALSYYNMLIIDEVDINNSDEVDAYIYRFMRYRFGEDIVPNKSVYVYNAQYPELPDGFDKSQYIAEIPNAANVYKASYNYQDDYFSLEFSIMNNNESEIELAKEGIESIANYKGIVLPENFESHIEIEKLK